MATQKFELTDNQLKSLQVFLGRVSLSGSEVGAFNELVSAFAKPITEKPIGEKKEVK